MDVSTTIADTRCVFVAPGREMSFKVVARFEAGQSGRVGPAEGKNEARKRDRDRGGER